MSLMTPLVKRMPKAKPLAQTLVRAAAEQGVCMEELVLACDLACEAYQKALDRSDIPLTEFQSEAEAAIEGV